MTRSSTLRHWFLVPALALACSARSGVGVTGPVGTTDVPAATDAPAVGQDQPSPVDAAAPTDVPAAPDDVASAVDVPAAPDVVAPADTATGPRCGDGTCDGGETCESCRPDCASMCPPPPDVPAGPSCGDGTCNGGETCATCTRDCGACMHTGGLMDPCGPGVMQGPDRDCGWRPGVVLSCAPNRATMVGCTAGAGMGSLCQPSYGACVGDPVLRVCAGTAPCNAAAAMRPLSGSFDDQCGTCPSGYVTCPASGQIYVMTGDYDSNNAMQRGTCSPVAR